MSILPPYLNTNDLILAISPSGKVDQGLFLKGCEFIRSKGFRVEIGQFALKSHYKFAGTHEARLADLQWALNHDEARAIFCGRGGYGVTYLLDQLDWTTFKTNPKWLIGYSDITALHHAVYQQGFCSIHGPILQGLTKTTKEDVNSLFDLLIGRGPETLQLLSKLGKGGERSSLIGGNLSMLINQLGTPTELDYQGCTLFIEEVGEYLYHIDRMLLQLKRAGKLAHLKALVVGEFTDLKESKEVFGKGVAEIIAFHCAEYNYPILYDFPIGHGENNYPLVHGGIYEITSNVEADIF